MLVFYLYADFCLLFIFLFLYTKGTEDRPSFFLVSFFIIVGIYRTALFFFSVVTQPVTK